MTMLAPPIIVVNPPGERCRNRLFEWVMTACTLGVAVVLLCSPRAIEGSRFFLLTEFGIGQGAMLVYAIVIGSFRATVLYWNGRWRYSYKARAVCSLACAVLWANMALALLMASSAQSFSISVPVFVGLTIGELLSCSRAVSDEGPR